MQGTPQSLYLYSSAGIHFYKFCPLHGCPWDTTLAAAVLYAILTSPSSKQNYMCGIQSPQVLHQEGAVQSVLKSCPGYILLRGAQQESTVKGHTPVRSGLAHDRFLFFIYSQQIFKKHYEIIAKSCIKRIYVLFKEIPTTIQFINGINFTG